MNYLYSLRLAATLVVAALTVPAVAQTSDPDDDTLFWHTSLEDAKVEAQTTGKPIFLEFRCAP